MHRVRPCDNKRETHLDISNRQIALTIYLTILVDRWLNIVSCFRVHNPKPRMQLDVFSVDISLDVNLDKTIGICNIHLHSLVQEPLFRPLQVHLVPKHTHADEIRGALDAGGFNVIRPFDGILHSEEDPKDAHLEISSKEDSDEDYTRRRQAATVLRERFGCSKMNKEYFRRGPKLLEIGTFGVIRFSTE
ncbi:hypothetical protein F4779DRAFT_160044 [Xylariaceae sp. FL0662B]|nr:hypothetical protein F4779DRAFT_160044 [Xylariaceae sp. FL0662B]